MQPITLTLQRSAGLRLQLRLNHRTPALGGSYPLRQFANLRAPCGTWRVGARKRKNSGAELNHLSESLGQIGSGEAEIGDRRLLEEPLTHAPGVRNPNLVP